MSLTPEDVVNKRFQPTKFREGYDQDEVDDFLDEIVVELRRLTQENEELRRQTNGTPPAASVPTSVPAPVAAGAGTGTVTDSAEAAPELEVSDSPAGPASVPGPGVSSAESAAGVLAMAQRLHDEYVNAGVEQRDRIIADAQSEATGMVSDAEEKTLLTLGALEEQKAVLEQKVEELREFERDYRSRLKAYIEGQLQDLDSHGSVAVNATEA
ncbi:DivIVA domain-containing protein [Arthrobacter sp. Br18]|uniref:DivIVA domain-containing protein n=1 Tax=Arthrobacter sp. Br18 TaxID=1312954 RepID=UPI00047C637B|nr:DivIVA domain-containing protein [Arthrobacter sp. Br18]